MSKKFKGIPSGTIFALAAVLIVALVAVLSSLMLMPEQTASPIPSSHKDSERIRGTGLPEELSADFQFRSGRWLANGPADDSALRRLVTREKFIKDLGLNQAAITPEGLTMLKGSQLKALEFIDNDVDVNMAKAISQLSGLKDLSLRDQHVSDQVLKALTGPKSLEKLAMHGAKITPAGLKHLSSAFPELKKLELDTCLAIDDGAAPILGSCKKLESLALIDVPMMTAAGIAQLLKTAPIKNFSYQDRGSIDKVIENLRDTKVIHLGLNGNRISSKVISNLASMKQLKWLALAECSGLTEEQIASLRKKLPSTDIQYAHQGSLEPEMGLLEE